MNNLILIFLFIIFSLFMLEYYCKSYYIIKNSWNTDWGQGGYMYFNADIPNMCGIAMDACYSH